MNAHEEPKKDILQAYEVHCVGREVGFSKAPINGTVYFRNDVDKLIASLLEEISELKKNEKIGVFLHDIKEVCKKHGLSISHEDSQGGFIIEAYSDENIAWLFQANDGTKE